MSSVDTVQCGECKKNYENNIDLFAVINFIHPICNECYKRNPFYKENIQ
jgi:NAD-dependent SIR2 family protein deacetylase